MAPDGRGERRGGNLLFKYYVVWDVAHRQIGVSVFPSEPNGFSRMVP